VILAYGRTGSTYLVKELNQTPGIRAYSEVFHPKPAARAEVNGLVYSDGGDSWEFVNRNVYFRHPEPIETVGFKLFYFHARDEHPVSTIWDELDDRKNIDIIQLGRKNLFAGYVSLERAKETSIWHPKTKGDAYDGLVEVTINIDMARRTLKRMERYREVGRKLGTGHRRLELDYEDLVADAEKVVCQAVEFLGVSSQGIAPKPFFAGSADAAKTRIKNIEAVSALLDDLDMGWMIEPFLEKQHSTGE
jgi:hypothetical protein